MKRTLSLLLVLTFCLCAVLSACGGNNPSDATTAPTEGGETLAAGADNASADNVLTVAMECAYAPYNWTQPTAANGAVKIKDSNDYAYGYDVMMAKLIAEKLGMELEIVKSDWDSLVPAVMAGYVDCVIAGQSITSKRLESVDFTTPYYYASIVTLVKADGKYANAAGVAELAGSTCTSQINTVWYDTCIPQIKDANILPAQDTSSAMLAALNSGVCDVVVTDMPTAMAACTVYDSFKLLDFTGSEDNYQVSDEEVNIGISLKKGNTELCSKINAVLAELTPADFDKMMNDAISVQPLAQ